MENTRCRVELKLTDDNDEQLKSMTDYIRQERHDESWEAQLGLLMMLTGEFNKVEEIYKTKMKTLSNEYSHEYAFCCLQFGAVN